MAKITVRHLNKTYTYDYANLKTKMKQEDLAFLQDCKRQVEEFYGQKVSTAAFLLMLAKTWIDGVTPEVSGPVSTGR